VADAQTSYRTKNAYWADPDNVAPNFFYKDATIEKFSNSQLIFTFLTPHASDMLEPRNMVPFYELPIYRTANFGDLKGVGRGSVNC
jgi:hypothetical protein